MKKVFGSVVVLVVLLMITVSAFAQKGWTETRSTDAEGNIHVVYQNDGKLWYRVQNSASLWSAEMVSVDGYWIETQGIEIVSIVFDVYGAPVIQIKQNNRWIILGHNGVEWFQWENQQIFVETPNQQILREAAEVAPCFLQPIVFLLSVIFG